MKTNRAIELRLYPNKEQEIFFAKTFGCARKLYNSMLGDKIAHYKKTKENLYVTPVPYKEQFPYMKEVDSLALTSVWKDLDQAYKNFFSNPSHFGPPNFKKKRNKQTYRTNNISNTIRIEKNKLRLPKIGFVSFKRKNWRLPTSYKIKSATIKKTPSGKYYAMVLIEFDNQASITNNISSAIGLDYSSKELYIDNAGNKANYPHYYRKAEDKLGKEQRKLSRMTIGSNNRNKQRIKVARVHEKIANQRKDFQHKKSRELVQNYDAIFIEDLSMKEMAQDTSFLKLGKSVSDNGWSSFIFMLEYKAKEEGKILHKVDKYFPSSQLCNHCGYQNPDVKDLSIREWICPQCNSNLDRDINAARNILEQGLIDIKSTNSSNMLNRGTHGDSLSILRS